MKKEKRKKEKKEREMKKRERGSAGVSVIHKQWRFG